MLTYLETQLPETGLGWMMIVCITTIGFALIFSKHGYWGYRKQRVVDIILSDILKKEGREDFLSELCALSLIEKGQLSLVGKMGAGIASGGLMRKVLAQYLIYFPEQESLVAEEVYRHFQHSRPWWLPYLKWKNTPEWELRATQSFLFSLADLLDGDKKTEVLRADSLRVHIKFLMIDEREEYAKTRSTNLEQKKKDKRDKHWKLAKNILNPPPKTSTPLVVTDPLKN